MGRHRGRRRRQSPFTESPPPPSRRPFEAIVERKRGPHLPHARFVHREGDRGTQQHAIGCQLRDQAPAGLEAERAAHRARYRERAPRAEDECRLQRLDEHRSDDRPCVGARTFIASRGAGQGPPRRCAHRDRRSRGSTPGTLRVIASHDTSVAPRVGRRHRPVGRERLPGPGRAIPGEHGCRLEGRWPRRRGRVRLGPGSEPPRRPLAARHRVRYA